ncbi:MAG: HPr family [Candidatus Tokpelaia sp. JSC189]|nr:MAG: HPr family [Candidatus Tokpelaia sp. JSC189]
MYYSESFDYENALTREIVICNKRGLHARASAQFVKVVTSYEACVIVEKDGVVVGGSSIMGLMILAASPGCTITVKASGKRAGDVLDALEHLVNERFGEEV